MSFSISVSGGSAGPHNAQVKAAFDGLVASLNDIEGLSGSATGYSNDGSGSVSLSATLAGLVAAAAAPVAETAPAEEVTPAEGPSSGEPSPSDESGDPAPSDESTAADQPFPGGSS